MLNNEIQKIRQQLNEIDLIWVNVMMDRDFWQNEMFEAMERGEKMHAEFCRMKVEDLDDDLAGLLKDRRILLERLRELEPVLIFDMDEVKEDNDLELIMIEVDNSDDFVEDEDSLFIEDFRVKNWRQR